MKSTAHPLMPSCTLHLMSVTLAVTKCQSKLQSIHPRLAYRWARICNVFPQFDIINSNYRICENLIRDYPKINQKVVLKEGWSLTKGVKTCFTVKCLPKMGLEWLLVSDEVVCHEGFYCVLWFIVLLGDYQYVRCKALTVVTMLAEGLLFICSSSLND